MHVTSVLLKPESVLFSQRYLLSYLTVPVINTASLICVIVMKLPKQESAWRDSLKYILVSFHMVH